MSATARKQSPPGIHGGQNGPRMIFGRLNLDWVPQSGPKKTLSQFGLKPIPPATPDWDNPNDPVVNHMIANNFSLRDFIEKRESDLDRLKESIRADIDALGDDTWKGESDNATATVGKAPNQTNAESLIRELRAKHPTELQSLYDKQDYQVDPTVLEEHFPELYEQSKIEDPDKPDLLIMKRVRSSAYVRRRKSRFNVDKMNLNQKLDKALELSQKIESAKAVRADMAEQFRDNLDRGNHSYSGGVINISSNARFDQDLANEVIGKGLGYTDTRMVTKRKTPPVAELRKIDPDLAKNHMKKGTRAIRLGKKGK